MHWCPSASLENLKKRAEILKQIRNFFYQREVLEVETPLLSRTSVTDPHIQSVPALVHSQKIASQFYYLQTSPEFAMKRLLAAGSGSIFQISKAFRQGELGRLHNPEFSILEWYQLGYDHHDLMNEVDEFLQDILRCNPAEKISYADLFQSHLSIDPHRASVSDLEQCARKQDIQLGAKIHDKDAWLNLLMTHVIEPKLGQHCPCFVFDFPDSQAALARIKPDKTASRFEVYVAGVELANGFHELANQEEQRQRFEKNLVEREKLGFDPLPLDENFLAALSHGLPDCAGVALGLDRLVMLATQSTTIKDVLSFDFNRC